MVWKEKKRLAFGLIIFILSFFNAAFYLFCDFGLYQVLSLINKHFGVATKVPVPPHTKLHVSGDGPMADMYRSIVTMFDPLTESKIQVNVTSCVPHPSEPDWSTYKLIGFIYLVCLILTISEAYGLRLRHIIMACYFPKRERLRALWLYNHIMKTRGGLMETAKDKIRKRNTGDLDADHISLMGRFAASFPICEKFLKWLGWEVKSCLYCGREGKPDDYFNFVHCAYYDCNAVFCIECYADLDNVCPVCMKAVQVTESDVSEEVDSSMSEKDKVLSEAQKIAKEKKIQTLKTERRASHQLANIRQKFDMPSGPPSKRPKHLAEGSVDVENSTAMPANDNDRNTKEQRQHVGQSNNATCSLQSHSGNCTVNYETGYLKGSKYGHGCDKCNNALVMGEFEHDSSDSSDTLSDCSSVCTDDLDFSYQYVNREEIVGLNGEYCDHVRRKKKSLGLEDESIYSDTDSDPEADNNRSGQAQVTEPTRIVILRG